MTAFTDILEVFSLPKSVHFCIWQWGVKDSSECSKQKVAYSVVAISSLLTRQHLQVETTWFLIQLCPKIEQKRELILCCLIFITVLQNKTADHWFLNFPCQRDQWQDRIRNGTLFIRVFYWITIIFRFHF